MSAPKNTLTVTDNRTGKTYEVPIDDGAIKATDLKRIKLDDGDPGLLAYDQGFVNTAVCRSKITYVDGERGILRYRGYPIEQLAEKSNYLEVAYLIVKGELPDEERIAMWRHNIAIHTFVHENVKKFMDGFRYDAHPMGMLIATIGALSTFYPESRNIYDIESRRLQTRRLIGKLPTISAFLYRRTQGMPYVYPDADLSYTGNFLSMMFRMSERNYKPNPVLERALDVLFILHADHEQNCSTTAMRLVASAGGDPYVSAAAAAAALFGPKHGGANEAVLKMLDEIGDIKSVPAYVKRFKQGEGRLMGFGHRVYKNYDPRARIIKELAHEVFEVTGRNPRIDIARELERIALEDDYFVSRKLYPNVDFYSGIIYEAMGIPRKFFPVMFAIPRTSGWLAQWAEFVSADEQKIVRPRQIYLGSEHRDYVPLIRRERATVQETKVSEDL
jgi:citrate synthase